VVAAWGPAGAALWLGVAVAAYILNVTLYSMGLKKAVILDVISLAAGFVLRVVGGCAAAGVEPSSWLLNCTFFVSMFLAFGKRLGERRTMGGEAAAVRGVQTAYTDELLRMTVVVTGVASLLTYAGYVQAHADRFRFLAYPGDGAAEGSGFGLNLLWLTVLPATYALLRCIVLIERGDYDDPTELASRDRPFQAAAALFAAILGVLVFAGPSAG
jgi:4-hydroxybenzoate polyprenyltransferase